DVIKALSLRKIDPPIKNLQYYKATQPNPTIEHLARFNFAVPQKIQLVSMQARRDLFVHFYNANTLVLADEEPLKQLLNAEGHLPELTPRPTPPAAPEPAQGGQGGPGGAPMPGGMPSGPGSMPAAPGGMPSG